VVSLTVPRCEELEMVSVGADRLVEVSVEKEGVVLVACPAEVWSVRVSGGVV
jgi:hypothetical protein